ncbi:MAG: 50S ribosomal protein L18 [Acidimicrobiia bacterium]
MMKSIEKKKQILRKKRTQRVRKHLKGTSLKPRLCVVKTNMHIEVQMIDDEMGRTIAATSTRSKEFRQTKFGKKHTQSARELGKKIAELARQKQITEIVFDRGPSKYTGIIAALADGARGEGLKF